MRISDWSSVVCSSDLMGGLAEQAIARAIDALAKHDLDAARRVIEGDKRIDAIEEDVERLAIRLIALRAPMADDLREVVAEAPPAVGLVAEHQAIFGIEQAKAAGNRFDGIAQALLGRLGAAARLDLGGLVLEIGRAHV